MWSLPGTTSRIEGQRSMIAIHHGLYIRTVFSFTACMAAVTIMLSVPVRATAEETLVVDASTISPSSARQWVLQGAETAKGPTGTDIVLTPGPTGVDTGTDLYLSFDDDTVADAVGHWSVETEGPYVSSADTRFGPGSGTFRAPSTKLVLKPLDNALFAPDTPIGDMTLEFWLKPTRADSGEIVLLWKANRKAGKGWLPQQVSCIVLRNRIVFGFLNFFAAPDNKQTTISLQGSSVLVPAVWSHHLVRFDSLTGLVEYLMNGKTEAVAYATSTGKQSGTIYNPVSGGSARLELAQNYTGLIDEFKLGSGFVEQPTLRRYPAAGGIAVSPVFDLGTTNSTLVSIEPKTRLPGESAAHWSYRISDSSVGWLDDTPAWIPFNPGDIHDATGAAPNGRYLQLRVGLYPDAPGELSPSVSSIRIGFNPDDPPSPPATVSALAGDTRITVRWSAVAETDVRGYVVYYGTSSGDYFGTDAIEGSSPVFVEGSGTTSLVLNGMKNGTLYFVAVATYDDAKPPHIGEFSRELTARPSRVSP